MDSRRSIVNLGAWIDHGKVNFRVWAPAAKQVNGVLENGHKSLALTKDSQGYFSGLSTDIKPGSLYKYQLDNGQSYPDPCSRFQPQGPHGFSMVVDSSSFSW